MNTSMIRNVRSALWAPICRVSFGAALGGLGAGLFGTAFGLVATFLGWQLGGILPVAGYFALCGTAAGLLVGMLCAIVDAVGTARDGPLTNAAGFVRPRPLINPLISRWNYLESAAADGQPDCHNRLSGKSDEVKRRRKTASPSAN
jgi:hypothetical protein